MVDQAKGRSRAEETPKSATASNDRAAPRSKVPRGWGWIWATLAAATLTVLAAGVACGRHGTYARFLPPTAPPVPSAREAVPLPPPATTTATVTANGEPYEVPQTFVVSAREDGAVSLDFAAAHLGLPQWMFWSADWQWADTTTEALKTTADGLPAARIGVDALGLRGLASFDHPDATTLEVTYDLEAAADLSPVIGGGVVFRLFPHPAMKDAPVVLPDGQGWAWHAQNGGEVRVAFDPPLPKVYAERGNPYEIRCFFFSDRIRRGQHRQRMRVSAPTGAVIRTRPGLPYAPASAAWAPAFDSTTGPDVSFLNRAHGPAGSHGRVRRDGERLVFADGTEARFWGTNLTAGALFGGTDRDVETLAHRLSTLGFNLVRLHHHDSDWVEPNIFTPGDDTKTIDDTSFAKLGRWVRALKAEGIYVWLDIHVGRRFKPGDGIRAFEEVAKSDSRGFDYVNPDLETAWEDFARQYLTRRNPSTGQSFAEDPAVVAVLLSNENDVTHHFGNKMLPDKPTPLHTAMFEDLAVAFADKTGLPRNRVMRTWEPGPAKIWLNELEHRVFQRRRGFLAGLGVQALVATTNTWGDNPASSLPSLTAGDVIDVHSYGEGEFLSADPRTQANFIDWLAAAQVAGFPLSATEWNVPWPTKDRSAAPLYVASVAALQGWDMVMQYAYQQRPAGQRADRVDEWAAADDPALMTLTPAAALLFRRGDVAPAKQTYRLELDAKSLYDTVVSADTSPAIRTLAEQSRLVIGLPDTPELDWDTFSKPVGPQVITDPLASFLSADATEVVSDTGQLVRSWVGGYQLIDAPRTQAASGWIGGRNIQLGAVTLAIETMNAAVAVTSLDEQPIASASRLLVTTTAQTTPGPELPFGSEPVVGTVRLKTACRCARALRPGNAPAAVELPIEAGRVVLSLQADSFAHFRVLERPRVGARAGCE